MGSSSDEPKKTVEDPLNLIITDGSDGWGFLPIEVNPNPLTVFYQCPNCKHVIAVMPFEPENQQPPSEQTQLPQESQVLGQPSTELQPAQQQPQRKARSRRRKQLETADDLKDLSANS